MDSSVLVILGSSVLKAGLWFAENSLYSVIPARWKESLGNVITAVSSNILALFASHTQGADVKDLRWLWCSVTLSLRTNGVWSLVNVWWLFKGGQEFTVSPWGHSQILLLLFQIVSVLMYSCFMDVILFFLFWKMSLFHSCHPKTQSPPLILTLNLKWSHNRIRY